MIDPMKEVVVSNSVYEYFVTDLKVGTTPYYAAAMAAGYYGVEDDGRCFRTVTA